SAREPRPTAQSRKKCRRVCRSNGVTGCMAVSFSSDELIEVQKDARHRGPGSEGGAAVLFRQQFTQPSLLHLPRGPRQAQPKRAPDALSFVGCRLPKDARGQPLGQLNEALIVEQRQRLQGRVGTVAARAGGGGIGGVEDNQPRMRRGAPEKRVHAAAVA